MSEVTYRINFIPAPGALGTQVDYRQGTGAWQTPATPVNPTTLPYYDISLTRGQSYDIRLSSIGIRCAPKYKYIRINVPISGSCCAAGYTLSPDGTYCYKTESVPTTIVQSDICFAQSQLTSQYSSTGTFLYDAGYSSALVSGDSHTVLSAQPQWKETPGQITGPMNREGIWVDTDCNGVKDALTTGQVLQITVPIVLTTPKTLYVGIAGDNRFKMTLNGVTVVEHSDPSDTSSFNIWHLFPVDFPAGTSYVVFSGVGDGSTNDCFAAVIYDNTAAELTAATSDSTLTRLFHTSSLAGNHLDIATCPAGYFLDTSAGQGNYVCKRVLTDSPFSC